MNKKKLAAILISGALVVAGIGGTLAWFTSNDQVTNEFATGTVPEGKPDAGIDIEEVFDKDGAEKVVPGTAVNKDVSVTSTANYDQFIRAKFTLKVEEDKKDTAGNTVKEYVEHKLTDKYNETQTYGDIINLNFFKSNGALGEDGNWIQDGEYYYYMAKVPGGKSTSKLLDSVTLSKAADNTWKNKKYEIVVDAEGVQASNDAVAAVFRADQAKDADKASEDTIKKLIAIQNKN